MVKAKAKHEAAHVPAHGNEQKIKDKTGGYGSSREQAESTDRQKGNCNCRKDRQEREPIVRRKEEKGNRSGGLGYDWQEFGRAGVRARCSLV